MGSFFTNVQLHTTDTDRVVALLADADGYRPAAEGETPDRSIIVRTEGPWTSVYDEQTESQDDRLLDDLAQRLSKALGTHALSVLVHDSDVLLVSLFERGEKLARHDSNPRFSGKRPGRPKPKPWLPLLANGAQPQELEAALTADDLFVDDTIGKLARLFGLQVENVRIGFRYAEPRAGDRTLKLRFVERPAYEQTRQGPPKLHMGAHHPKLELSLGQPQQFGFSVRNVGGASRGLDVVVAGEAVERGLVRAHSCELITGDVLGGAATRVKVDFGGDGVARFPDAELPASTSLDGHGPGLDPRKTIALMHVSQLHANLEVEGLAVGEAKCVVGFVPRASPEQGQWGYGCDVSVVAASRRPLRSPPDVHPHLLRQLDEGSSLVALASSALPKAEAVKIALELIPRWAEPIGSEGKLTLAIYRSAPGARPKTGEVKANGFFESKRWKELREELKTEAMVTVGRGGLDGRSAGFSFGTSIIPRGDDCPTLGFWGSDGAAHSLLVELIDTFMQRGAGTQAFIARWTGSMLSHHVPYESAVGISGLHMLSRAWQTRWLRAVSSDFLWISDELLAHVKDRAKLEAAAELQRVGSVTRLKARSSLDALEAALADILPTMEDSHAAVMEAAASRAQLR